ncbi:MAG: hypothetical protein P8Y70_19815 [Candidatus Lokiarchaeota archaeon]
MKNAKIWLSVAKKEFRIFTYRFRKNRIIFLIIISLIFTFWGFYFGPLIFESIFPAIFKVWASQVKNNIADLIGYFFALTFLTNIFVPIYDSYRSTKVDIREIEVATPVKLREIIFADFLWKVPFNIWVVLIIGPIFISLLDLINKMTILNYFYVYSALFGILIFSLLIGTLLVNLFERNILKSKKEKGNYYIFLLTFIILGLVYFFQFIINYFTSYPNLKIFLLFFPSFWYSNFILYNVDSTLLVFSEINFIISLILACIVPILFLILYYRSLENIFKPEIFDKKTRKNFKFSYLEKMFNFLNPKKWRIYVSTQMKELLRDKENRIKILFTLSTIFLTGIVLLLSYGQLNTFLLDAYSINYSFDNYKLNVIFLISWISSFLVGFLNLVYSFFKSKEIIYFHRKTPKGINVVLKSYIYSQVQIILFFDIIITPIFSLLFFLNFIYILLLFSLFFVFCFTMILICVGIQCLNPLYKHKSKIVFINIYYLIAIEIVSLFIILNVLIPSTSRNLFFLDILNQIILSQLIFMLIISPVILLLGIIKIQRLE